MAELVRRKVTATGRESSPVSRCVSLCRWRLGNPSPSCRIVSPVKNLHDLAEERSLAYHQRVAELLPLRPELLGAARRRAAQWAQSSDGSAGYARRWLGLLALPLGELTALLTDRSEAARALRQATPFAGALDPRERWLLWEKVRAQWEAE